MPELLHPGVYVQELPPTVRPIEGVSSSTAGFVGVADMGPTPGFPMPFGPAAKPFLVTSFTEFTRVFGGYRHDSFLAYAVRSFFDNGGRRAYVSRVAVFDEGTSTLAAATPAPHAKPDARAKAKAAAAPDNARPAAIGLNDREATAKAKASLAVVAQSPGVWGNKLSVRIVDSTRDTDSAFKLIVLNGGLPVESYDDLSMDSQSDNFVDDVVNSRSSFVYVKSVVADGVSFGDARPAPDQTLTLLDGNGKPALNITGAASLGGALTVTTTRTDTAGRPTFRLVVAQAGNTLETYDGLSLDSTLGAFVERKINGQSRLVTVGVPAVDGFDPDTSRPVDGSADLGGVGLPAGIDLDAGPGSDGRALTDGDAHYLGRSDTGTGLFAFDTITDVNILAIPGQGSDLIVSGGMAYCRNRPLQDVFFIGDVGLLNVREARQPGATPDLATPSKALDFVRGLSTPNDYGAVYFPWVRAGDPIGRGRNPTIALPPSGFMAGVYARIDNARGVFKAPAGTETGLAGALGLLADVQDADQDSLNPSGLNALRRFPVYGTVAWGARTLATDPAWRYIPVRRMAIFLRASIYRGIQWAVFEPNDEPLWAELRLNIRAFMLTQFRAGAFQGRTPDEAFLVKCDSTTTTQQDIDNGVVNILVAFAPLKPAEFVVLSLSQKVNQQA